MIRTFWNSLNAFAPANFGANKEISLKLRLLDFEVLVGTLDNLEIKLQNLKAFYQKAKKDTMLDVYKSVNLQFDNQVVCTKK